jgi:hypothetical protein
MWHVTSRGYVGLPGRGARRGRGVCGYFDAEERKGCSCSSWNYHHICTQLKNTTSCDDDVMMDDGSKRPGRHFLPISAPITGSLHKRSNILCREIPLHHG